MAVGAETWVRTDLGWINAQYVVLDDNTTGSNPDATTPTDGTTPDATTPTGGSDAEFVG